MRNELSQIKFGQVGFRRAWSEEHLVYSLAYKASKFFKMQIMDN